MIMQIMINFLNDFYDDTKCLCTKLKSFGQRKQSNGPKNFGDFENGLLCMFCPPAWLLHHKCIEISLSLTVTLKEDVFQAHLHSLQNRTRNVHDQLDRSLM